MSLYEDYIAVSRYARYLPEEKRREIWPETVARYIKFFSELTNQKLEFLREPIQSKSVLPSMRALMTSGPALARDHCAAYNCAYTAIDHPRTFDEALYIMLCGTGLGFSVERQHIYKLPEVA